MAREGARHLMMLLGHDVALAMLEKSAQSTPMDIETNVWLGNTGALTHMGHCDLGMINVRTIHNPMKIGNGLKLCATKIGIRK